jgi:hypothetical protein
VYLHPSQPGWTCDAFNDTASTLFGGSMAKKGIKQSPMGKAKPGMSAGGKLSGKR